MLKIRKFFNHTKIFNLKKEAERINKISTKMTLPSFLSSNVYEKSNLKYVFDYSFPANVEQDSVIVREVDSSKSPCDLNHTAINSFYSLSIDFPKDSRLRNDFVTLNNKGVRIGKLLELFDFLTSESCFKHIGKPKHSITLVTASVSSIEFFDYMSIDKPLVMNTYLTGVGTSSMEVRIDLYDNFECKNEGFYGSAFFTFVARDPKDYKIPLKVPPLILHSEEMIANSELNLLYQTKSEFSTEVNKMLIRNDLASYHRELIKKEANSSLYKVAPTNEEIELIHNMFLKRKSNWASYSESTIPINSTKVEKIILNYREHANYNGHVFGGFIMREGMELCYACLKLFDPKLDYNLQCIHSVVFYKPVMLSSVTQMKAYVVYKEDDYLHTNVEIYNIVSSNVADSTTLTTVISITFKINGDDKDKYTKMEIIPEGYECGIRYLEGKRKVQKLYDLI